MNKFYYSIEFLEYKKSELVNSGPLLISAHNKLDNKSIKGYIKDTYQSQADTIILSKVKHLNRDQFSDSAGAKTFLEN